VAAVVAWAWLRARDPGLVTVRRAARVAIVACVGFYACRYGLGNPVLATYALFGTVALGALSQLPGTAAQRARTLLAVLPAGAVLVTAGTLLSITNWTAAAGMFVLGFLVTYAGVGGPRLVGLVNGMQLLYILPCFPPYDPHSLGYRLAGLALAVLLLVVAELTLWPERPPVPYQHRLAHAVRALADCLGGLADAVDGDSRARERLAAQLTDAAEAAEAIRPSRLPPIQRPASAGRRDRALSQAGGAARLALGRTVDLFFEDGPQPLGAGDVATQLRQAAASARAAAAALDGTGSAPDLDPIADALAGFRAARLRMVPDAVHPDRLRLGALALVVADGVKVVVTAVRVATGAPIHPDPTPPGAQPGPFWYAYRPTATLWWHRFRENLTPRSVYFQGALRLALALAAARLLAGLLDLSHGFWVLLATLTLLRTSAADTRSALRPALVGTVAGAVLAGGLLVVVADPQVYVIALPLAMLIGFAAGPLLGPGWAQALFTVVIAMVFAQVAAPDWRLAEARVLDVAVGAGVGLLIGLFAWPRGGAGELHRATANFLAASAAVVRETVAVLTEATPPGPALPVAREQGRLAEASYALYQSERHDPRTVAVDWQATLVAGHHVVRGAEALLRSCPTGRMLTCRRPLTAAAATVAGGYEELAARLRHGGRTAIAVPRLRPEAWPDDLGTDLYHLADIRVWLAGLADDLAPPDPTVHCGRTAGGTGVRRVSQRRASTLSAADPRRGRRDPRPRASRLPRRSRHPRRPRRRAQPSRPPGPRRTPRRRRSAGRPADPPRSRAGSTRPRRRRPRRTDRRPAPPRPGAAPATRRHAAPRRSYRSGSHRPSGPTAPRRHREDRPRRRRRACRKRRAHPRPRSSPIPRCPRRYCPGGRCCPCGLRYGPAPPSGGAGLTGAQLVPAADQARTSPVRTGDAGRSRRGRFVALSVLRAAGPGPALFSAKTYSR